MTFAATLFVCVCACYLYSTDVQVKDEIIEFYSLFCLITGTVSQGSRHPQQAYATEV